MITFGVKVEKRGTENTTYVYSLFKRILPEIGARSLFSFLEKREQGKGEDRRESVMCPGLVSALVN